MTWRTRYNYSAHNYDTNVCAGARDAARMHCNTGANRPELQITQLSGARRAESVRARKAHDIVFVRIRIGWAEAAARRAGGWGKSEFPAGHYLISGKRFSHITALFPIKFPGNSAVSSDLRAASRWRDLEIEGRCSDRSSD